MDWKWMKDTKYIVLGCAALFILINCYALTREFLFVPLLSMAVLLLYLLFFHADTLVYLLAFSIPFSIIIRDERVNLGLSIPSEIIMISLTLLFLCRIIYDLSLDRRIARHPVSIAIYVYLLWMFITSITSQLPLVSFKFLASKIWFIVSSYFVIIRLIKGELKNAVKVFNWYALGLACIVIITTIKHAMTGFAEHGSHWIMAPFYNDHTAYGAILAFFIPITASFLFLPKNTRWQRVGYIALLVIFFTGLYFSFSRAAWLSFVGIVAIFVILKLRIKFSWVIVGAAALFGIFYFFADDIVYKMGRNTQDSSGKLVEHLQSISNISTDASNVERLNRWVSAFGMIKERPVLGWGPGTYQFEYAPFQKGKYKTIISTNFGDRGNAHSEYIGPCAETGFVGLATVLAMMIIIIYYGIHTYIQARSKTVRTLSLGAVLALISYYIHGVMNNFLDTEKLAFPFFACFALIVVLNVLYMNKEEDELSLKGSSEN